jgi:oxygen-independent coproporphyrinogen III oxidase
MQNLNRSPEHVYIHIPFCLRKCSYCSFYSEVYSASVINEFLDYLLREISLVKDHFSLKPRTIYFGGGTPSLLKKEELEKIISSFDISNLEEMSLEANPVNITPEFSKDLLELGINRISLGVQSFLNKELKILGRLHDQKMIFQAWTILQENGFSNLSLDLMYGLPRQKKAELEFSLLKALSLDPQHISIYCLSLENNVPLFSEKNQLPTDEIVAGFFQEIRQNLTKYGFKHYEISNFSKPGFESRHNLAYWNDKSYIGLGPSASGYIISEADQNDFHGFRYTNKADLGKYYNDLDKRKIMPDKKILSKEDHQKEFIFLNLRKSDGFDLATFYEKFNENFPQKYKIILEKYLNLDLMEIYNNRVKLKPEAYFISNEIFSDFV